MDNRLTPTGFFPSPQAGLSFIEILVSIVLLSLIGIAFSVSLGIGKAGIIDDGYRRIALTLVEEKMEELKALGYDDAALEVGVHQDAVILDGRGTVDVVDDLMGTRRWTVVEMEGADSYKRIALRLSWTIAEQVYTVDLDTFVAKR